MTADTDIPVSTDPVKDQAPLNPPARLSLNEERFFAEWVDRTSMRVLANSGDGDDVAERIEKATRHRRFPSLDEAKAWMQANVALDEYESPRVETMRFMLDDPDGDWPVWTSIVYQEWSDGEWSTINDL